MIKNSALQFLKGTGAGKALVPLAESTGKISY
jgi:hypothetical protein